MALTLRLRALCLVAAVACAVAVPMSLAEDGKCPSECSTVNCDNPNNCATVNCTCIDDAGGTKACLKKRRGCPPSVGDDPCNPPSTPWSLTSGSLTSSASGADFQTRFAPDIDCLTGWTTVLGSGIGDFSVTDSWVNTLWFTIVSDVATAEGLCVTANHLTHTITVDTCP